MYNYAMTILQGHVLWGPKTQVSLENSLHTNNECTNAHYTLKAKCTNTQIYISMTKLINRQINK